MNICVSVIVPIYNVSSYIERCTRALLEQTLQNVEFIFVDDASPDNSIEILERVIADFPQRKSQIKVLHNKKNLGLAATRFVGMDVAQGDFVIHCDSDDWVELNMLEVMYEKAIAENADIVCCEAIKERVDNRSLYSYDYDEETQNNGLLALNFSEIHIAIWNKLIRRSLFTDHKIRNYEGINMAEDSALTVRLRYYSKKTVVIHQPFYHYNRLNQHSMVANVNEKSAKEKIRLAALLEEFFRKNNDYQRFIHVVNFYKFESKQYYIRVKRDLKQWRSIYPECHADILRFKQLTPIGRIKWWFIANMPLM